jgi:HEAT repeat protein
MKSVDSNPIRTIIDILPFVLATDPGVAMDAATSVHKLVVGATANELVWLDQVLRRTSSYSGDYLYQWFKLSPNQLSKLERFEDASESLLGIASFHSNGYVREAAINRLALIASGAELPFLILRANDWVAGIREAAYDAIQARLKPDYAQSFIRNLMLVSRLAQAGRSDPKPLIESIYQLLQSAECRTALLESLESDDRFIKRACFKLALNSSAEDLPEVVRKALAQKDTVIRVWAAQKVSSAFTGATLDQFVKLMKHDKFTTVRREALRILVQQNAPALLVELRAALLDTHASMREEARYHLRKLNTTDVAEFYRDHFLAGEGVPLYSVISGLGETGETSDDHFIVPYTTHRASKIRGAAIQALAKLNRNAHVDIFIEALNDQVPHVSRQALNALADKASSIDGERIWELFRSATHEHVKRNALSVLESLSKWDSIYYLLRAVRDSNEAIADKSRFGIECWLGRFNRNFSSPTAEQLVRLGVALEENGNLLDDQTLEQLRFSMAGFKHR